MRKLKSVLFGFGFTVSFVSQRRRANFLKVKDLRRTDVFMSSYPRSGNTWTRMIVSCLLDDDLHKIDLNTIDETVPEARTCVNLKMRPRVFKEHCPAFDLFPRVIYNYRDGRDAVLSAYKYWVNSHEYNREFSDFLFDRRAQIFGFWHEHVQRALSFQEKFPDRIIMIKFDDLINQRVATIKRIAEFLGKSPPEERINEIIKITSIERQNNKKYSDPRKKFTINDGECGKWREKFPPMELKAFEGMAAHQLRALGFLVD